MNDILPDVLRPNLDLIILEQLLELSLRGLVLTTLDNRISFGQY